MIVSHSDLLERLPIGAWTFYPSELRYLHFGPYENVDITLHTVSSDDTYISLSPDSSDFPLSPTIWVVHHQARVRALISLSRPTFIWNMIIIGDCPFISIFVGHLCVFSALPGRW